MAKLPYLREYKPGDEHDITPPDPTLARPILGLLDFWQRYHRYSVDGLEHVPASGGALVVSFHALTIIDMLLLGKQVFERDGRVLRGLTDHRMFDLPVVRDVFVTLGILDGTPENARRVLADGQLAVCMPGGGLEWSRSTAHARTLRWGDHRGYARLAIAAGVPIVATACPAADDCYLVPFDGWTLGEGVQRWLGTSRIWPLPIGIGLGPLPFPVKLTSYVAPPIEPGAPPEAAADEAAVAALDQRVRETIRDLLGRRT